MPKYVFALVVVSAYYGNITRQRRSKSKEPMRALPRLSRRAPVAKLIASCTAGFTLVEIMIVIAIIGLLAGIAIPSFLRARGISRANTCINHLRQIDAAIQEWATENKKGEQQSVQYSDISFYLKGNVVCPAGGSTFADSYSITTTSERPTCKRAANADHPHVLLQSTN